MNLKSPGRGFPERTGETGCRREEENAEDENAGGDGPAGFDTVDGGVNELDEGYEEQELAEGPACADREQPEKQDGYGEVAGGGVSGVDMDGIVDGVVGTGEHGGVDEGDDAASETEEGAEKGYQASPKRNAEGNAGGCLKGHDASFRLPGVDGINTRFVRGMVPDYCYSVSAGTSRNAGGS